MTKAEVIAAEIGRIFGGPPCRTPWMVVERTVDPHDQIPSRDWAPAWGLYYRSGTLPVHTPTIRSRTAGSPW